MQKIRKIFFKILYVSGIGHWMVARNKRKGRIPVLVFHKIIPENDEVWPGIHPQLLDDIVVMLKKHYEIRPVHELVTREPNELKRACFITVDDGYLDYLEHAYPVLQKHKAHSTIYILPSDIKTLGRVWTSSIIYMVKNYSLEEIVEFFKDRGHHLSFPKEVKEFEIHHRISNQLCKLTQAERWPIIKALHQKFVDDKKDIDRELISFDQLKQLDPDLVDIASHSLTHPSFRNENDESFIDHEMGHSKEIIERQMGRPVLSFAFPFAKYNPLSLDIVKRHYMMSFTDVQAPVDLKKISKDRSNLYELARYNVYHDSPEEVFFLINGFHSWFS